LFPSPQQLDSDVGKKGSHRKDRFRKSLLRRKRGGAIGVRHLKKGRRDSLRKKVKELLANETSSGPHDTSCTEDV